LRGDGTIALPEMLRWNKKGDVPFGKLFLFDN
jgi:hypothetical protein